jgi:hypothetical protein
MKAGFAGKDAMRENATRMLGVGKDLAAPLRAKGDAQVGRSNVKYNLNVEPTSSSVDRTPPRTYKKGGMEKKMIGGGIGPRYNKGGYACKSGGKVGKANGGSIKGIADKVVKVMNTKPISDIASRFMKKGGKVSKMTGGAVGSRATSKIGVIRKAGGKFAAGGAGKIRKGVMTANGRPC